MAKSKSSTTVATAAPKPEEAKPQEAKPEVKKTTVVVVPSDTPYQLNQEQTLKAAKALIKFVGSKDDKSAKKNLLTDSENPNDHHAQSIWLNFTTKKFTTDVKKLKPIQISLPHPIRDVTTTTACLIVKDPQRAYKDLVAAAGLTSTVTRVIGVTKLRAKFHSFESLRLLRDSHDIFIADDNIVRMLPKLLGKTFYRLTNKVPIPVEIKPDNAEKFKKKIEKTLASTMLHLSTSATTSIRVGLSTFTGEQIAENVQSVVNTVLEGKKLPGGWRGARSIHIKSPSSVALPIWLTPQLFDETDILSAETIAAKEGKSLQTQEKQATKNKERTKRRKEKNEKKREARTAAEEEAEADKSEDGEEMKPTEEKVSKSTEKLVDASVKEKKKRKRMADVLDKGLDASVKEAKKLKAKKL